MNVLAVPYREKVDDNLRKYHSYINTISHVTSRWPI